MSLDTDIVSKKRRKRRTKRTTERFEDTQEKLNQIINKTIEEYEVSATKDEDEILFHLMQHAEQLKSFSIELLSAEGKVREFRSLESSVLEQYQLREKAYQQRIEECERASQQQLELIDSLARLCHELEPKKTKENHRRSFMTATTLRSSDRASSSTCATSVNSFYVNGGAECHKRNLRYKLSLWVGGSVGTGSLVHSFDNQAGVKEFIISGSGVIFSMQYDYVFHINQELRDLFKLLPSSLWIPDDQVDHCPTDGCPTRFSFIQRKHHCRRCGRVICHMHSLNKLPLFSSREEAVLNWYRVCNMCFSDLIIPH